MTDEQLALASQAGDTRALDELVRRYARLAASIAYGYSTVRSDYDDVRQEALIAIVKAARTFRTDGGASFKSLAMLAIRRAIWTVIRTDNTKGRRPIAATMSLQATVETESDELTLEGAIADPYAVEPHEACIRREQLDAVVRVFTRELSEHQRAIVTGFVNDETYLETAERLGLATRPIGSVRSKTVDNALRLSRDKVTRALDRLEADAAPLGAAA